MPTVQVALASSFVNRVTPANVGGMALNVRYMQKAGVRRPKRSPASASTSSPAASSTSCCWSSSSPGPGRTGAPRFSIPSSSKLLVAIAVVLAVVGVVAATWRGRKLLRSRLSTSAGDSLASIASVGPLPGRLAALFGGSLGVTLAYITALACAVPAFDGGVSLPRSAPSTSAPRLAAAAPTPGGLGALEAALVAGLTGVGHGPVDRRRRRAELPPATFWLPILPLAGWPSSGSSARGTSDGDRHVRGRSSVVCDGSGGPPRRQRGSHGRSRTGRPGRRVAASVRRR